MSRVVSEIFNNQIIVSILAELARNQLSRICVGQIEESFKAINGTFPIILVEISSLKALHSIVILVSIG
jgi:hypothetical protein